MKSPLIILIIIALLLASPVIDGKRRKKTSKVEQGPTTVDTIVYSSEEDKQRQLDELKKRTMAGAADKTKQDRQKAKLMMEEQKLRRAVQRTGDQDGVDSKERAMALHKLGRNLYLQDRYYETFEMSLEIARIHAVVDGKNSLAFADALGNVGSVANRVKDIKLCEIVMKRQLRILLDKHGPESKEVLIQRARMMSFRISDGETTDGFDAEQYEDEMVGYEEAMKRERKFVEEL